MAYIGDVRRQSVLRNVKQGDSADGELSLKEVGAAMGISPGAARTLLCRARKKLKTRLEGQL